MTLCGLKKKTISSQYLKNRIPTNETTTLGTKPSENELGPTLNIPFEI